MLSWIEHEKVYNLEDRVWTHKRYIAIHQYYSYLLTNSAVWIGTQRIQASVWQFNKITYVSSEDSD